MNFKSTLWALAFACAAVSCSDDLENGPNNNEGNEEQGGYYMTVNIATGGGSSLTKANGEGNEYLDETDNEDKVHDVNVFLIKSSNYSGTGTDDKDLLGLLNMDNATNVKIAGQGFTSIKDGLTPDGGTEPNHDKVEVKMQLTEPIPGTSSEKYQVFTVVNAGKKLENITTLAQLRDFEYTNTTENGQNPVWTGAVASADKFVMSTHKMTGTPGNSVVTLSAANMDASNPAVTNVYVERLAARIDLKVAESLLSTGYTAGGATIGKNGTFKLTGYTVVNRWNGDSYLFKQVSPTVDKWNGDLPGEEAPYRQNDPKKYLGNEKWERTGTTTQGSFNYVVEPKTRSKTGTNWLTASYLNPFNKDGNLNTITSNNEWVTNMSNINSSTFSKIAYTKENTMTVNMQKNGYSTGVIFESEFTPNENFKVSKYSEGSITDEATLSGDKTFLVANHQQSDGTTSKVVYADVKTIAAMAFDGISTSSMTEAMYKGFMDGTWPTTESNLLDDVKSLISQMKESNKVEAAFKKYLSGIANAKGVAWANVKDNLTYSEFINFLNTEAGGKLDIDDVGTLFKEFGVSYYKGGKSYHKFWIRHDNNDNNNVMGVMEFCIVRNNVYQLDVTGVRDLGDPLPYTPGKDDPNNPDESGTVSIMVNIYVKDWVKRSNSNITL